MNNVCFQGRTSSIVPVLLVLLFAPYSSMADDFKELEKLYNETLAHWDFEDVNASPPPDILEGFCQTEGIYERSFAAVLQQPPDASPKSAKITLSQYSSSNCPTDPLACEEGFTVAFWLSLKNSTVTDVVEPSNCMLLSLNDTSSGGFQVMLNVDENAVTFHALGTSISQPEAFNATNIWMWNHLGMTWNNGTSTLQMYVNGENWTSVSVPDVTGDSPLPDAPGCSYTALDDIAIWSRPLSEDDMMVLRLDRFNETEIMTTTQQETTTSEVTTPDPTTETTLLDLTLPDAVNKVKGTNNTREIIENLEFVHAYLAGYGSPTEDVIGSDKSNIQSILNAMPSKIELLDNSSETQMVLEKYMAIVNDVLTINKKFASESKMLISGVELALDVDQMLSAYINTVSNGEQVIQNTYVDTTLSESVATGSDITMKLQKCHDCSDYDIVVVIPSGVFEDSQTKKQASASTFYEGVKEHLPKHIKGDKTEYRVASYLVGVNLNVPSTSSLPVNITISISVKELNDTQEAKCAFLDSDGGWSTDGVSSVTDKDHKTVNCTSNHLTNFAVLVSTREQDFGEADLLALEILTNVGLAISITCLLLTLIILNVLRQLSSNRISILKHTAAALLVAQVMFIVGASPTLNKVEGLCTAIAALLHYFFLAVFCWMLIQGVQLYMKVRRALKGNIDMVYFCVFGWGFPAIIVAISVGVSHTNYKTANGVCWISVEQGVGTLIAFIGPAYLILVINMVVLFMVMHVFLTVKVNKDKSEMDKLKSGLKAVIVMVPILGVTWFFGLFIIISPEVVFVYLFVIFNTSQGVFMFLFHVVFNDEVKQAVVKKRNKIAASKDSNSIFSKALKSKSGSDQTTTEATLSSGNQ